MEGKGGFSRILWIIFGVVLLGILGTCVYIVAFRNPGCIYDGKNIGKCSLENVQPSRSGCRCIGNENMNDSVKMCKGVWVDCV